MGAFAYYVDTLRIPVDQLSGTVLSRVSNAITHDAGRVDALGKVFEFLPELSRPGQIGSIIGRGESPIGWVAGKYMREAAEIAHTNPSPGMSAIADSVFAAGPPLEQASRNTGSHSWYRATDSLSQAQVEMAAAFAPIEDTLLAAGIDRELVQFHADSSRAAGYIRQLHEAAYDASFRSGDKLLFGRISDEIDLTAASISARYDGMRAQYPDVRVAHNSTSAFAHSEQITVANNAEAFGRAAIKDAYNAATNFS